MANLISQNNIRYTIDTLLIEDYGVIVSKTGAAIDFSNVNNITGINIDYSQPGNSKIFIAFQIDSLYYTRNKITITNGWYMLDSTSSPVLIHTNLTPPDFQTLKEKGNTPESLADLDFSLFEGKKIGVAIGLYTDDVFNSIPKIKISFNINNNSQQLSFTEYSQVYNFDSPVILNWIEADKTEQFGGTVNVTARAESFDGTQINYTDLSNLRGAKVSLIQFKADYYVPEVRTAYSRVNSVNLVYAQGNSVTSGVSSGEIVTITQNWYMNINQVRMNVRHAKLINSKISAAVAFRDEPKRVYGEILGTGDGGRKVFDLKNSQGIKYDTIKLYYDNQRVYSDFEFNTQSGKIACEAPAGVIVSCDYEWGWEKENWFAMDLAQQYELDDYDRTEFRLILPDSLSHKSVCAVKIILQMSDGKINSELLGTGKGILTTYRLSHKVLDGNIKIYANGSLLNSKNWYLTEDPQYVRIAANVGVNLSASYDWISETPVVYQISAVFG